MSTRRQILRTGVLGGLTTLAMGSTLAVGSSAVAHPYGKPHIYGYQYGWRWCRNCEGMFDGPRGYAGRCPEGGAHDGSLSLDYVLPHFQYSPLTDPHSQPEWAWCSKCQGLHYAGDTTGFQGYCPAGGQHTWLSASYNYHLEHGTGVVQNGWQICPDCRGLWYEPHQSASKCTIGGPHSHWPGGSYDYTIRTTA